MTQTWASLLFAHWPVPAAELAGFLPAELELDRFDGSAWLGLTPFALALRPRGIPFTLRCLELNLRTYVTRGGRPGVWFLRLDATSRLAVAGARFAYGLPYARALAAMDERDGRVDFQLSGSRTTPSPRWFRAAYRAASPSRRAPPGSLEHWLTERYCLYSLVRGTLCRSEVHHRPWPLRDAAAEVEAAALAAAHGLILPARLPLCHLSDRIDVLVWPPEISG